MFPSMKRQDASEPLASAAQRSDGGSTMIARGVKVEGDFTSQGNVVIEGDVNGHVTTTALLSIGSEAKLKAEISAEEASIAGQVEGTVTVKKRLELKPTAKITGDIVCETIIVEAGATLNGKIAVGSQHSSTSKTPPLKSATA